MLTDRLIGPQGVRKAWSNARIDTRHSHGTGCTLASAIATGLGLGLDLIEAVEQSILEVTPTSHRLPSGPLHDAAEIPRAAVPTEMISVQSLRGISHNKIEDTLEEHLRLSVDVLDRATDKTMAWILSQE